MKVGVFYRNPAAIAEDAARAGAVSSQLVDKFRTAHRSSAADAPQEAAAFGSPAAGGISHVPVAADVANASTAADLALIMQYMRV
jgi:hypothetical protein